MINELTVCIEDLDLRSRIRAAAILLQTPLRELSLAQLMASKELPRTWVLLDQALPEIMPLIDTFCKAGLKPETQLIRFIDKPWQEYVYHDIPIFASIVIPRDALSAAQVLEKLARAVPLRFDQRDTRTATDTEGPYAEAFVQSPPMRQAVARLRKLKHLQVDTVLLGPTGAGKDTAARWLHDQSGAKGEFVHVNCAGLPEQLFEAEFFGVTAGAYTGANRDRPGKLEQANGGTLYLDEIDSLSLECQAKLLTALQYRGACRLGGQDFIQSQFRVIASTKTGFEQLVMQGRFREDLHYRLSVSQVRIPALNERLEDIVPLYRAFLVTAAKLYDCIPPVLDANSQDELLSHSWPGNVRELSAAAQRHVIGLEAPEDWLGQARSQGQWGLKQRMIAYERAVLLETLRQQRGSVRDSAGVLGIPVHSLYYRLKRFDIPITEQAPVGEEWNFSHTNATEV